MARMYSRKKGKSGSTKPTVNKKPIWIPLKSKEIEMLIIKMAKDNISASKIGLLLRDQYGIPDVKLITKKSISKILNDKKLSPEIPEDLMNLIRKAILIRKHLEENHKDQPAKRGLILTESKILRLSKYYKKSGKLSKDWKYDHKTIRLQVD